MKRLAREGEVRLADGLGLGRVRVDELGNVGGRRLPVVDELRLGDQLADASAHQVDAEDAAAASFGDDLRRAGGLQDGALAVALEVVDELGDLNPALGGGG